MSNSKRIYRAAIYVRLSKEDGDLADKRKAESNSISNQKSLILNYLKDKEDIEVVSVREDDGYSGASFDRPAFKLMMQDIKDGAVDCIVVKDLSRFAREYIDAGRYIERMFPALGVRFIAINDGYDSADTQAQGNEIIIPFKNLIKNISHLGKVSNDFSLFRRLCCINRCFRCSCGKFSIVHGVQAAIGFLAAAIGEKGDLPETHPVQQRTESIRPCRSTRAKPASKGLGRTLSV